MTALVKLTKSCVALSHAQSIADLPESAGVYVVSRPGEILYVGESQNLRKRWKSHDYARLMDLSNTQLHFERCTNHKKREREYIECLQPTCNGRGWSYVYWRCESLKTGRSVEDLMAEGRSPEETAVIDALKRLCEAYKTGRMQ